ncbi:MAG: GAF domain-containing protein [candidate division Zixibacteria bacterium]|nr:GAF domain-containing protein [candidate division Zixibacteria bacterium]
MEGQTVNLGAGLISLSALVVVLRFRPMILALSGEVYRHISSGLVIMALVATARLGNDAGFFVSVPFFSEPLFFKLTSWIATITATVLLASGISGWLERGRSPQAQSDKKDNRYDLLKQIEQLVAGESRTTLILERVLELIVGGLRISKGAIFVRQQRTGTISFLSAAGGLEKDVDLLRSISTSASSTDESDDIAVEVPPGSESPRVVMPLRVKGKLVAVFLLWTDKIGLSIEDQDVVRLVMDILGRSMTSRKLQLEVEYGRQQNRETENLQEIIDSGGNFDDRVVRVARLLRGVTGAEYLSFTMAYTGRDSRRYTVGRNGTLLSEKGLDPIWLEDLSSTMTDGTHPFMATTDMEQMPPFVGDIMKATGVKDLLVVPLQDTNCTKAVLLLGPVHARGRTLHTLRAMIPVLARMLSAEIGRYEEEQFRRRHTLVNCILSELASESESQQVYQKAANVLLRELRTSSVRISTFEENGTFLRSRALALTHSQDDMVPADGHMIMSLMPYHRLVRDHGRLMVINQENAEGTMSQAETRQMYRPDLKSALLVPITLGQQVCGVISLADRRRSDRYHYTPCDVLFVSSVAAAVALVIRSAFDSTLTEATRLQFETVGMSTGSFPRGSICSPPVGPSDPVGNVDSRIVAPESTDTEKIIG